LYATVVKAGVHKASSIKEAEAAKVIENTQRDLNIALMNELAIIFDKLGIDTKKVLEAAGTKWNFLPFSPGLVGGHCIGVDPYYLTYKAEAVGYHPQVILSGRRINDNMGRFIVEKAMKMVIKAGMNTSRMRVGILGLTFKEDCPDLRNTKVVDIYEEFLSYGSEVLVHDPLADPGEAEDYYGIKLQNLDDLKDLGVLVLAVAHREYREMSLDTLISRIAPQGCLIDVKAVCDLAEIKASGVRFWRL
jgi:UDP-N-acetyl-D-galactosamine dehydrogenase